MIFYPHHIGDFNSATRHLTRIERSIYRDLIDLYYDTESPIPLDTKALCRKLLAKSDEELTAVEQVLNEFFTETEQGWLHERCEREISKYRGLINAKSIAGKASAAKRAIKDQSLVQTLNTCSTGVEHVLCNKDLDLDLDLRTKTKDLDSRTKNISTKNIKLRADRADIFPEITDRQLVNDWMQVRNKKNAPATKTALKGFMREVDKSGLSLETVLRKCCESNWSGFNAEWMHKSNGSGNGISHSSREQVNKESTERAKALLFPDRPIEKDITHESTRL